MAATHLLLFVPVLLVLLCCPLASEGCTPNSLKNSLLSCLSSYSLNSFYHLPLVGQAKYDEMCNNSVCIAQCMETAIQSCSGQRFVGHLEEGKAYKAAFLGFCAESTATIQAALLCGEGVDNSLVLNAISTFETSLETRTNDYTVTTTLTCSDYQTMTNTLLTQVRVPCTDSTVDTQWTTFLNTMYSGCDNTVTPSWYTNYHDTVVLCQSGSRSLFHSTTTVLLWFLLYCSTALNNLTMT